MEIDNQDDIDETDLSIIKQVEEKYAFEQATIDFLPFIFKNIHLKLVTILEII